MYLQLRERLADVASARCRIHMQYTARKKLQKGSLREKLKCCTSSAIKGSKRSKILSKDTVAFAPCLSFHLFLSVHLNLPALEPVVCVPSVTEARPVCRLRFVAGTGTATGAGVAVAVVAVALLWHRVVF